MSRQTKISRTARGADCTLKIGGICKNRAETTVGCHFYPLGGRGKNKSFDGIADDMNLAFGCFECHTHIDGMGKDDPMRWRFALAGVIRTHRIIMGLSDA